MRLSEKKKERIDAFLREVNQRIMRVPPTSETEVRQVVRGTGNSRRCPWRPCYSRVLEAYSHCLEAQLRMQSIMCSFIDLANTVCLAVVIFLGHISEQNPARTELTFKCTDKYIN